MSNNTEDGILFFLLVVVVAALLPFLYMWTWGLFAPAIFGLKNLTWTQAMAMMIFTGMLRGSSGRSKWFNKD